MMNSRAKTFCGGVIIMFSLLVFTAFASCGAAKGHTLISFTGTVQYFELEGGFYAIKGDDGIVYDPINLASEYNVQGLRVHVDALVREDLAGTHMVGPIIEIINIRTI